MEEVLDILKIASLSALFTKLSEKRTDYPRPVLDSIGQPRKPIPAPTSPDYPASSLHLRPKDRHLRQTIKRQHSLG
jgi:hypothetical protein